LFALRAPHLYVDGYPCISEDLLEYLLAYVEGGTHSAPAHIAGYAETLMQRGFYYDGEAFKRTYQRMQVATSPQEQLIHCRQLIEGYHPDEALVQKPYHSMWMEAQDRAATLERV
jgi:hypothetical protein